MGFEENKLIDINVQKTKKKQDLPLESARIELESVVVAGWMKAKRKNKKNEALCPVYCW